MVESFVVRGARGIYGHIYRFIISPLLALYTWYLEHAKPTIWRAIHQQKKSISVQFYYSQTGAFFNSMAHSLKARVAESCRSENIALEVLDRNTVDSLKNDMPVIVPCVNASRLGTDVLGAVNGLPDPGNTAVIVLHIKEQHALPSVPSEKLLVGQEYRDLGRIIDMAYLPETGLYTCDMNTEGQKRIVEFIQYFSTPVVHQDAGYY